MEARERIYIDDAKKKAVQLGYRDVRDRMLKDPQYALQMAGKLKTAAGYNFMRHIGVAAFGAGSCQRPLQPFLPLGSPGWTLLGM